MEAKEYRLTDVCDFQGGTQPPKEEWINEPREGYVRMLQIRDFTQDKSEHVGYVKDTQKLSKCKEDDILIGRYGASVGKILTGHSGAFNVAIIKTIPKQELITKKYLYYVLTGTAFQNFISTIGARAAQAGFNKEDLSHFKFYVPTNIKDQHKIVDVLDKNKQIINKRGVSIKLLETFLEMKYLEMFGNPLNNPKNWETLPLFKVTTKVGSGSTPRGGKDSYFKSGISFIRSLNIYDLGFEYKNLAFIDETQAALLKNVIVNERDVLFNITGASVCRCTIVPSHILPARVNQHVSILRPNSDLITSEYLAFTLVSKSFKKYLLGMAGVAGATREALTKEQLENLQIPVPDIILQRKFTEIILQANKFKEYLIKSKTEVIELFDSLSQKALKGTLDIIEKIYIEAELRIQPKISVELISIGQINKELEEFHKIQLHTGAPEEIDNKIRQLETELSIKGEVRYWDEYVKYKIIKGNFAGPFTFDQLWQEITKFPFETVPEYDEVASLIFKCLEEETPFLKQIFNKEKNQIELIVNETSQV